MVGEMQHVLNRMFSRDTCRHGYVTRQNIPVFLSSAAADVFLLLLFLLAKGEMGFCLLLVTVKAAPASTQPVLQPRG